MNEVLIPFCPYCGTAIQPVDSFCPHCGKSLEELLRGISIGKQIYIYFMSLLLPPAGIVYGMRYLKIPNQQVKTVGIVAIILTVISLLVSVWLILDVVKQTQDAFSKYRGLGL